MKNLFPLLIFCFLNHEVFVHTALLSITLFNLKYEYVINVAQAEDINLFCRERGWRGVGGGGVRALMVPLLIGWLNSVCSL